MAEITIKSVLEGLYKEVYGDKLHNLIPDIGMLIKEVPFRETEQLGNAFHIPVIVSDEQGATYAGPEEDGFALEAPEAMNTKDAVVKGSQILMRAAIGYKAAAAAAKGGKQAFVNATEMIIKRLMNSISRRVEVMLLYGGSATGIGEADSSVNINATSTTVTFTLPTWGPGIWVGQKNASVDFYDGVTLIGTLKVGSITDLEGAKMTFSGLAGDISAIDTALAAGNLQVFWKGAKGKEALGLDGIMTTSGLLFTIDNTVYDLFKSQLFNVGGVALSFDLLTDSLVNAILYGLDEDVQVLVSPRTWQDLNKDEAALRQYDYSYKPGMAEKGNEGIKFHLMNITVEIKSHAMVKEGEAFCYPKSHLRRVGAYEISMKTPGYGDEMFRQLENNAAFELRAYTDQALFSERPSHLIKLFGIVNS